MHAIGLQRASAKIVTSDASDRMTSMSATRRELERALDDLEERLPHLIRDHIARDEFWAVFHAYADPIIEDASYDDFAFARQRIEGMLDPHGLTIEWP